MNHDKILIIRMSAIGDIVMALPIAKSIKQTYPNCKISWLVQPEFSSLVQDNPNIDEVIIWPKDTWKSLWKNRSIGLLYSEIKSFRNLLQSRKFDIVLDIQGLMKSSLLAFFTKAPVRIGLGSREFGHLLMTKNISRNLGDTSLLSHEYRYLAEHLKLGEWHEREFHISHDSEKSSSRKVISHISEGKYLVFAPYTTRPQKHWPDSHWVQLSKIIKQRHENLAIILLGGPGDKEKAQALADNIGAVTLAGITSLQEAAAVIEKAELLVGVDTGLTHMAHAVGTPSVAIFGSTTPYLKTSSSKATILYSDRECSPCHRTPTCNGKFYCMSDLSAEQVLRSIDKLVKI